MNANAPRSRPALDRDIPHKHTFAPNRLQCGLIKNGLTLTIADDYKSKVLSAARRGRRPARANRTCREYTKCTKEQSRPVGLNQ